MIVLSSFSLEPDTNDRVRRAVEELGGSYLSIPVDRTPNDRDERITHIDTHIAEAEVFYGGRLSPEQWAGAWVADATSRIQVYGWGLLSCLRSRAQGSRWGACRCSVGP